MHLMQLTLAQAVYRLAAHLENCVEPAGAKVPASRASQDAEASSEERPTTHHVQLTIERVEYCQAAHLEHCVDLAGA